MSTPGTATVADVVRVLAARYDPRQAMPWDAVGLVCGDPAAEVRSVLFAVDVVAATVDEALGSGRDLLIAHHPLLLRPVTSVAATTSAGRLVHRLVSGGVALLTSHTDADVAPDGVSDALARALGLDGDLDPILPTPGAPAGTGLGRVGMLAAPTTLAAFAAVVHAALPPTAGGVRVAGDPDQPVRRVAVCGGSGADVLAAATTLGADVVVTSDLKHHNAGEHLADGGPALVDVAHWASEWPWLSVAADLLLHDLAVLGVTVGVHVSRIVTDPWTARL